MTKVIRVANTTAARILGSRRAGMLIKAAGLHAGKQYDPVSRKAVAFCDESAKTMSTEELESMAKWVPLEPETPPEPKVQPPTYMELLETIEKQNTLITEMAQELSQLRQLAARQNNLSNRARLALTEAGRHLKVRF